MEQDNGKRKPGDDKSDGGIRKRRGSGFLQLSEHSAAESVGSVDSNHFSAEPDGSGNRDHFDAEDDISDNSGHSDDAEDDSSDDSEDTMKRARTNSAGRGRGAAANISSSQMQVDSVGGSTTPSVGGSQASTAATASAMLEDFIEEEVELTEEEYLQKLKDNERSDIWAHFRRKMVDGLVKGVCLYCKKEFCADPNINGTSSLNSHMYRCRKYPPNLEMIKTKGQKILCSKKETRELDTSAVTEEELTRLCVEMIILDELPFSHVEGIGFQRFMKKACPFWKIPGRKTVAKNVLQLYMSEKEKLKNELKGRRVCLTTDTWTSIQNINYMVVTVHFIDDDWVLHKRVINFFQILDHKGESIAKLLEDCLLEWGIEKILTITVDNASANDVAIRELIKRLDAWDCPNMVLNGGKNMHMRCVAHILNLIVNDGLKQMNMSIEAIRNSVKYVRSSPKKLDIFKKCVERVKIESKGLVVLDVPTRWNSTYLMLQSALKFQKAFERLFYVEDTENICAYFKVGEANAKEGPPTSVEWKNGEVYREFLKPFYEVTLRVCCSNIPIIHHTFNDLLHLYGILQEEIKRPSVGMMEEIVPPMIEKYTKYWGDFDELNQYVFLALVLDPRQKFEKLVDYLEVVFGEEEEYHRVESVTKSVKTLLYDIYHVYEEEEKEMRGVEESQPSNDVVDISFKGLTEFERKMKEKELKRKAKRAETINNDVDRYISDTCDTMEGDDENFNLLNWWRVNGVSKYPILARIAKDILATQVSTISSESSFSTSGRVISPHQSSLSPRVVEALLCTQSWLRGEIIALHHVPTSEEMEICEEAEKEVLEMPNFPCKQGDKSAMLPPKMKQTLREHEM